MKRVGGLFDRIHDRENLRLAAAKALRGKRGGAAARRFTANLEENLARLADEIRSGAVSTGRYHPFLVRDPKERLISAPCFRERVLHHAVMSVCEPVLESFAIHDSYACRTGKGQFAALDRARQFARRYRWFLKLDVRKYFESVPKAGLLDKLSRRFREERVLALFGRIVRSFEPEKSRGLPIGALTSQHLANFYLGSLDRFAKETLRAPGYVRYMDDFVLWSDDRAFLRTAVARLSAFAGHELGLELKPPHLGRTASGMDFLGHRVFPGGNRLSRRGRRRFRHRCRAVQAALLAGRLSESAAQERLTALTAFTGHAVCKNWRRRLLFESGSRPETATPTASTAAAVGTTTPATAAPRTATGTPRPSGTTTSASGWP